MKKSLKERRKYLEGFNVPELVDIIIALENAFLKATRHLSGKKKSRNNPANKI